MLIINMFHSVPGVPRAKVERFAGADTQTWLRLNAIGDRL